MALSAAWPSGLGKGLQSPVHRFDSGRRLQGPRLRNKSLISQEWLRLTFASVSVLCIVGPHPAGFAAHTNRVLDGQL